MKFWGLFKIENLVINSLKREKRVQDEVLGVFRSRIW
jgi:hypothetical protein